MIKYKIFANSDFEISSLKKNLINKKCTIINITKFIILFCPLNIVLNLFKIMGIINSAIK